MLSQAPSASRSLRRRFLVPFAIGVGLLSIAVGVVAAMGARGATNTELENRARTAERIFREAMVRQQARMESEANSRAVDSAVAKAVEGKTSSQLAGLGFSNTLSNRFDYVGMAGPRGAHVYSARGADWSALTPHGRPLEGVTRGISDGGIAVARDGTPVLFSAVSVRIAAPTFGVIVVGEPIKSVNLEEIAQPLGLTLELRTSRGKAVTSLGGADHLPSRVRTFSYPLRVSDASAGTAELRVSLSTVSLARATRSAALVAAVVALGLALVLLLLAGSLLDRAVVRPLASLQAAIRQVKAGVYDSRLPLSGSRELVDLADGFNRMAAIVGEQQARLEVQATRDSLTGLLNHACFHEVLEQETARATRKGTPLAILVIDVDYFKEINDQHGHPAGDGVLRAIGACLQDTVRAADVAARLGGDEFALLLPEADADRAFAVAERVRAALGEIPITSTTCVSTSVGIACYPSDTGDATQLVELADRALYDVKRAGRGGARRYGRDGAAGAAEERAEVLALLGRPEALGVAFQPIVSLADGVIRGYEALARFPQTPGRGPDVWFSQAHRCGLGVELEICALMAALSCDGLPDSAFLALNLSPTAIMDERTQAALPEDLTNVVVEVTEQELVTDVDALLAGLAALRRRGARIALDDTGAGYAGLQRIMCIEPDVIKLDRYLVRGVHEDAQRSALIESLAGFAERTGGVICAEGIENVEELLALARLGIGLGQGYLLARPGTPWPQIPDVVVTALGEARDARSPSATATPA